MSQQTIRSHPRSCKGSRIPESPGIRRALRGALHTAVAASSSGRIILEVFAGSQRFTKEMKKLGHGVVAIDSNLGAHCDVLNTVVLQTLLGWITSGRVQGILIATPCGSQSRARRAPSWSRFPSAIRSTERPRGLAGLTGTDLRTVTLGNRLADAAFLLIQASYKQGIIGVEENPFKSYLWLHRCRVQQLTWPKVSDVVIDMCQCGASFRKRTQLRLWHWSSDNLANRVCNPVEGLCSGTRRKHVVLSGLKDRQFATSAAQEYHVGFAKLLALEMHHALHRQSSAIIWNYIRPDG